MDDSLRASPHHRVRSSIACARCRRSKIKCLNTGPNTTCKACSDSGRECLYPSPTVIGSKREGDGIDKVEVKRPRVRKSEGATLDAQLGSGGSLRRPADALDPTVLTPKVWQDVFELFQLHFATDLPFLHAPTFLGPLCEAAAQLGAVTRNGTPNPHDAEHLPGAEMLLLGLLSLTARFHSGLIAHHSGREKQDPAGASEYYATALRAILVGAEGVYIGQPNLQKIQALLMLGLHDWGMCKGVKAWIHVGLAIRMAQAMGLQFDDDLDDEPWALSSAMRVEAQHLGVGPDREYPLDPASSEAFIEEEMRRRTFWSCFIMDRYLSSGKYRPSMLSVDDIRLQLPCSEHSFAFGERVCTSLITGNCSGSGVRAKNRALAFDNKNKRKNSEQEKQENMRSDRESLDDNEQDQDPVIPCEVGSDEGLLSRFVRMVEIWGQIAKWSCAGGRRTEKYYPWQPESRFYKLRESLSIYHEGISRAFRLTPTNIQAHLTQRTSSPFTLMHTLYSLCLIILHREYIPFVPIRCDKPEGPLDYPTSSPEPEVPKGFWEESARQLFKAGRDMMDLVQACQARGLLLETPILGFGIYTVAFVGVYAINFPHMDPDGYLCSRSGDPNDAAGGQQAARKALEMIGQMCPRLPMASSWFRTIHRVHRYYEKIKADYDNSTQALRDGSSLFNGVDATQLQKSPLTLREGGPGNGVETFHLLEKTLKEFGSIEDEDVDPFSSTDRAARHSFNSSTTTNTTASVPRTGSRSVDFTAINVGPLPSYMLDLATGAALPDHVPRSTGRLQPITVSHAATNHDSASGSVGPALPSSTVSPYRASASDNYTHSHDPLTISHHHQSAQRVDASEQPRPIHNHDPNRDSNSITNATINQPGTRYWNQAMQDVWLDSLRRPLGGDDVALFVDGRSCEEWGVVGGSGSGSGVVGFRGGVAGGGDGREGWLSEVWGVGAG